MKNKKVVFNCHMCSNLIIFEKHITKNETLNYYMLAFALPLSIIGFCNLFV